MARGRERRRPPARDAAVERERRERERRERARRRAAAAAERAATRPAKQAAASPKRRPPRSGAGAGGAGGSAVAARERHEGLVGWVARQVVSLPSTIGQLPSVAARVLRGFVLEVVAIVRGVGRILFGWLPGSSKVATTSRTVVDTARERVPRPARRSRMSEARRARLRTNLRAVLVVALLASVVAAWVVVPASDAFRIRHVEVTGAAAVTDLQVRERIDTLLAGKTVFTVDEEQLASRIEELPFVREVRVERHLPGGLQLHIAEYRPLALGFGEGRFWLVARDGRVLAKANRDDWAGRIPTVTLRDTKLRPGDHVDDEPALRLLAAMPSNSMLEFELIKATEYSLSARLANGTEVRFGRAVALKQKLLVAQKMLREAARKDVDPLYIDVTVPGKPAFCSRSVVACGMPRGNRQPKAGAGRTSGDAKASTLPKPHANGSDELAANDADAG